MTSEAEDSDWREINSVVSSPVSLHRSFKFKEITTMKTIYKYIIRPHLDYASPIWNPHLLKDINLLEGVQRRFTRLIPEISNLSYPRRLAAIKLKTLEERRRRADLIETYKIFKGLTKIDPNYLFTTNPTRTTRVRTQQKDPKKTLETRHQTPPFL